MNPTEQKIRECADEFCTTGMIRNSDYSDAKAILTRHFGQPEQPDKSLDSITKKCLVKINEIELLPLEQTTDESIEDDKLNAIRQASIEYAVTLERKVKST